jgi:hypothetical protein
LAVVMGLTCTALSFSVRARAAEPGPPGFDETNAEAVSTRASVTAVS